MSVRPEFPQKRPRTDPDTYSHQQGGNNSENSLVTQLEGELELQRSTFAQQQANIRSLQVEKERLEGMLCRISGAWTKLLAELDAALPQEDFAKEALITLPVSVDGEGDLQARLEHHRQLLRDKVRALLTKDRPAQPLSGLHRVVTDFATRSLQLEISCRTAKRAQEEAERSCDQLRSEVAALRKSRREDPAKPYREDITKLKSELELVNRARAALEDNLAKLQAEARVSEERFVTSRSFQRLIRGCQALFQRLTDLNTENLSLRQLQEDMNDRVASEVSRLRKTDETRIQAADSRAAEFLQKYEQEALEKTALLGELTALRREQTHSLRLKETEMILGQRETELEKLKRKLREKKAAMEEMETKWTQNVAQIGELEQKLISREGDLAELKERLTIEQPTLCENSFQSRLSQYREEQNRLRAALRKSEADLSALNSKLTHTQTKLANEKTTSRRLCDDVDNTAKAYEQAMRQNKALVQGNKALEAREAELAAQLHIRLQAEMLNGKELELALQRSAAQVEIVTAQKAVIEELERNKKEAQAGVVELQCKLKELEDVLKETSRKSGSEIYSMEQTEGIKQQATERCRELEKRLIASETEITQLRFSLSHVESRDTAAPRPAGDESAEQLWRLLECGICAARMRDAVIAKCFHSFCHVCLESRLRTQAADCPACKQSFAHSDLRPLYWQ